MHCLQGDCCAAASEVGSCRQMRSLVDLHDHSIPVGVRHSADITRAKHTMHHMCTSVVQVGRSHQDVVATVLAVVIQGKSRDGAPKTGGMTYPMHVLGTPSIKIVGISAAAWLCL